MMKPQVAGRTGLRKHTLSVTLDFDYRVGRVTRIRTSSGPCDTFLVYLGGKRIAECFRFNRTDDWEFRWLPRAPLWMRSAVEDGVGWQPMGWLGHLKQDAERRITRAFEHGFRRYFADFDPERGARA